jgi:hypothetical protein
MYGVSGDGMRSGPADQGSGNNAIGGTPCSSSSGEAAPHVRQRVEWTSPEAPTVWLAIEWHFNA